MTWGWFPALFWIICGTIFIGAVHDFGALVLSARKDGHTTGAMIYSILSWIAQVGEEGSAVNWMTIGIGLAILLLEIWMIVEAILIVKKLKKDRVLSIESN